MVLLNHGGIVDAAEREDERAEHACAVFARRAVHQYGWRIIRGRQVGKYDLVRLVVAAGGKQYVLVGF